MFFEDSSKNAVLKALATEFPLSAKEVHSRVSKALNKDISYQAVHKILLNLNEMGVLSKIDGKYLIDSNWVKNTGLFFSNLEKSLESKKPFLVDSLVFDSVYAVDKFLVELCKFLNPQKGDEMMLQWIHFWIPLFTENETYKEMKQLILNSNFYSITPNGSPIDKWCAEFWKDIGVNEKIGVDFGFDLSFLVYGDTIVQVLYPTEIKKAIDDVYNSTKDPSKLDINKFFSTVFEKKTSIPVLISKNKEVAEELRQRIKSFF